MRSCSSIVVDLLTGRRFNHASERDLQDGIAAVLTATDFRFEREAEIAPGAVVDFLVEPGVALEVKVGGGLSAVTRQLHRYAESDLVLELLLVSSRVSLTNLPPVMRGKPVRAVALLGGLL